jgi:predicted O-methyltransferase YrrM
LKSSTSSLRLRLAQSLHARCRHWTRLARRRVIALQLDALGLAHAPGIRTWTHPDELEALFQLASECPEDAQIVELGSYLGASTCYLAAGAATKDARICCIDTWQNETMPDGLRDTFAEFQRNTAGIAARLALVRKPTVEVEPSDLPAKIDLGFIDADHSYEATKADAALLAPLIAPEGRLAFHDTTYFHGVARVIAELLESGDWSLAGHCRNLTWLQRAEWNPWTPNATPQAAAATT